MISCGPNRSKKYFFCYGYRKLFHFRGSHSFLLKHSNKINEQAKVMHNPSSVLGQVGVT